MSQTLPPPKKKDNVTEYELEVSIEDFEKPIEVPLVDKKTRLVIKLRPSVPLFSV